MRTIPKIYIIQQCPTYKGWLILFFLTIVFAGFSQEKKKVEIIADYLDQDNSIVENAQRFIGHVLVSHNEVLMWCDSAYSYTGTNKIDAFGNVHINQGDTIHLYAKKIYYNGDISFAQAMGDVRLVKFGTTLYTDTLDYEMDVNIGYYEKFGKIVDSTNVLTSEIGRYFVDLDFIDFYKDVKVVNDDFTLNSDTLKYETETKKLYIEGPTTIKDSLNNLYTEDGWYDSNTGYAELLKNPVIANTKQTLKGDIIKYNRENGNGDAFGSITITDDENQMVVKGHNAKYDENLEIATVTDSAILILYSDEDSLYLHADTLMTFPDSIDEEEKIIKAYWGVKFYRGDIQGACDSLIYFSKDSIVQMFLSPILWSGIRQMSSDFIQMSSFADKPDEVLLQNNSFIIAKRDSIMFDQIKGKNMIAYTKDQTLSKIDVDGNGQTLYYAQDNDEIVGLNKAESSKITMYFIEGRVDKIAFISAPEGVLNPLNLLTDQDRKLSGFEWKEHIRPLFHMDVLRK